MNTNSERLATAAAEAASATAAKTTFFGGTLSAVGGIALSSEIIAIAGLALAGLGWATQVYFSYVRDKREAYFAHRHDVREHEEHELKMTKLKDQP